MRAMSLRVRPTESLQAPGQAGIRAPPAVGDTPGMATAQWTRRTALTAAFYAGAVGCLLGGATACAPTTPPSRVELGLAPFYGIKLGAKFPHPLGQ